MLRICAALQIFVSAAPGFGLVLCRAADGHVAVEAAHGSSPCETDFLRHHPTGTLDHGIEQHGCSDTVLADGATGQSASRSARGHAPDLVAILPIAARDQAIASHAASRRTQGPVDRHRDMQSRFRSTILLI